MDELLTIGQLADLTGVQPGTLRIWEQRHDFPHAERLPSGHRRYPVSQVERVLEVVRARESGLSLAAAVERANRDSPLVADSPSIFAGLRKRRPDLAPYPVPKRMLVPISHAMEDECSARGGGAILIGSFQRERFYRQAEPRWRAFARTAELTVALGDFEKPRAPKGAPIEIPIDRSHPLSREWAIVCDGPGVSACLAGWERPGSPGDDSAASSRCSGQSSLKSCARRRVSGWSSPRPSGRSCAGWYPSGFRNRRPPTPRPSSA